MNLCKQVEYALVPAKLLYSPPARSVLGTSLNTTGDEPIAKSGRAKTQPDRLLATTWMLYIPICGKQLLVCGA